MIHELFLCPLCNHRLQRLDTSKEFYCINCGVVVNDTQLYEKSLRRDYTILPEIQIREED